MNIGLQPQYPILWWILVALGLLALLGAVVQAEVYRRAKRKARARFEEEHADWEKRNETALVLRKKDPDAIGAWIPPEPRFNLRRSIDEPTVVPGVVAIIAGSALALMSVITIAVCVPFNSKYFNYYVQTGTVSEIVSTVSVGDDSIANQFTIRLADDPKPYTLSDPRIKTLEGQRVALLCGVGWNYQAADSWICSLRDYAGSSR